MNKQSPESWRSLKPGSTITLSDKITLEEAMKRGEGVLAQDYIIKKLFIVQHAEGLAEWIFYKIESEDEDLWLLVKAVDDKLEFRVYTEPEVDEFEPGDRKNLIDNEQYWLFIEPEDPDNFEFDDLEFTDAFLWEFEDDDGNLVEANYSQKNVGIQYGSGRYIPAERGLTDMFTSIIEFKGDSEYEYTEALIMEIGGETSKEGGWITLMLGYTINETDIDILEIE
ncbi:hypothetical protein K8I28_07030 [bacterium]|nr:hypothetical protein [bacterium]